MQVSLFRRTLLIAGAIAMLAFLASPRGVKPEPGAVPRNGVVDVGQYIPPATSYDVADATMARLTGLVSGNSRWLFPCYAIKLSRTVRFRGANIRLEGCGGASLIEMHDIPAYEADGRTRARNADGSQRFVNAGDDLFVFGMDPLGNTTADITITDLHLNRDGDTTGGAGLKVGQGARVYIERVSVTNFFHDFALLGGVAIHLARVYSNTGAYFPFARPGSADLLVTPYVAPSDHTVHTGSGVYVTDSEFSSTAKVSAGYELEGIDTTMVINSYFGGQACQVRIDAARVEGGTNSQTIMFDNTYLDGGGTATSGLCVPVNRNGWNDKTRSFDGSHYGPVQLRFANGTSQSHLDHDIDIAEPATDRIGLFNDNFGNNGKAASLFVRGHSAQVVGNNIFAAGHGSDIQTSVLLYAQNALLSVADCQLAPPTGAAALTTLATQNVDDGGCKHRH